MSLYYGQGVGFFRPTRLAPEPGVGVAGGSLGSIIPLVTERPDNPRLAGLGCEGDRQCAPCAAKAQAAAFQAQRLGSFRESGTCPTSDSAVLLRCSAVEWANYALKELLSIGEQAKALGGPGFFGATAGYYQQFEPLLERVGVLNGEFGAYRPDLDEVSASQVSHFITDAQNKIGGVQNGRYEDGMWDSFLDTLRNLPAYSYTIAAGTVHEAAGRITAAGAAAGKTIGELKDAAESAGKWVVLGLIALAAVVLGSRRR